MKWPSLSIIIPSYNQGDYIERTILSILKQEYEGRLEVIVSDGGSNDGTVDILKRYPQIVWWSEPDKGYTDAVMKAAAIANGEILAIQSSDDFYLRDAFKISIQELMNCRSLGIIAGCDIQVEPDRKTFTLTELDSHFITPHSLLGRRVIPQHTAFFRKDIVFEINGFREEVDTCADIDFWYRALHHFKAKFIPVYTAAYQFHSNQRTRVLENWYSSIRRMVELCESDPFYSSKFRFSEEDKMDVLIRWEMFCVIEWGAGREDRQQVLERVHNILCSSDYRIEAKKFIYGLAASKGLIDDYFWGEHGLARRLGFVERLKTSVSEGTLLEKAEKKLDRTITSLIKRIHSKNENDYKNFIDIDWWK